MKHREIRENIKNRLKEIDYHNKKIQDDVEDYSEYGITYDYVNDVNYLLETIEELEGLLKGTVL